MKNQIVKNEEKKETTNEKKANIYQEAGRKGGLATAAAHGESFYKTIGRKGGLATSAKHNKDFYKDIGHKGGKATASSHNKKEDNNNSQAERTLEAS